MSNYVLDFESPLREIEVKIESLKSTGIKTGMDVSDAIKELEIELKYLKIPNLQIQTIQL